MDYAQDCRAEAQVACTDSTPLDSLAVLTEETERSAHFIQEFIDRFRGSGSDKVGGPTPVPSGHMGQIARLREAVSSVDKLARELRSIG